MGEKIVKVDEGRPLGEMLMWAPTRGAEPVKKTGWERAQVAKSGEILS